MSVVIDASTALAAVLPDEHSGFARAAVAAALEESLIVPVLWIYEVQNALAVAVPPGTVIVFAIDKRLKDHAAINHTGVNIGDIFCTA